MFHILFSKIAGSFWLLVHLCMSLLFAFYSLGEEIVSHVLEIIDVQEVVNDSEIDENDFVKTLEWSDIWIILLNTNGMFYLLLRQ